MSNLAAITEDSTLDSVFGQEYASPEIEEGSPLGTPQSVDEQITDLLIGEGETGALEGQEPDDSVKQQSNKGPLPPVDHFKNATGYDVAGAYNSLNEQAKTIMLAQEEANAAHERGDYSPQQWEYVQNQIASHKLRIRESTANVQIMAQQANDQAQQRAAEAQHFVMERNPELFDTETRNRAIQGVINQLRASGYTDAEISQINDGRMMNYLYNNWKQSQANNKSRPRARLPMNKQQKAAKQAAKPANHYRGLTSEDSAIVDALLGR